MSSTIGAAASGEFPSLHGQRRTQAQAGAYTLAPWRTALAISVPFVFAYSVIVVLMAVFGIPLEEV